MKPRKIRGALSSCLSLTFGLSVLTVSGQTGGANSWTKPTSGNWEEPFWSLGVLPNSSQSVFITNSGWKAVAINPSTRVNFPDSMTVGSLTIRGAWDTFNTLLLNFTGNEVPLTVLNGLELADNARILIFHSALDVQGGGVLLTNAQIVQDGGFVRTINAPMTLQGAEYHLTNGVFEAGIVRLGPDQFSTFHQYDGAVTIQSLQYGGNPAGVAGGGTYFLHAGTAQFRGNLRVSSDANDPAGFLQNGGSNLVTSALSVETGLYGVGAWYTLNEGFLGASNVSVLAPRNPVEFTQNGGIHIVTNALEIRGGIGAFSPPDVKEARYTINDGLLQARTIALGEIGSFIQSNGVTLISGALSLGGGTTFRWNSHLAGGTLGCADVTHSGLGVNFLQSGGALFVTNTLSFGGQGAPFSDSRPTFTFQDGTMAASNIDISAGLLIDSSSQAGRIANPGFFKLAGRLSIADANESLGRFILASNSTIYLAGNVSRLSFANSSVESWTGAATLSVRDWNGNPAGGGAEQLKFGASQSALTPSQVSRIQFVNPAGLPAGIYPATILPTGEVVPAARPKITTTRSPSGMSISWTGDYQLLTSTNVAGPYTVIQGATNPYPISFTDPQRFFYLRSP